MSDAYADVKNGEAWLINMQITEYPWANRWNHEPKRDRKLLLHRKEIEKLEQARRASRATPLLPLEVYLKQGKIKVLLGVCKGKKQYDKRQDQKRKDAEREVEAALRRRRPLGSGHARCNDIYPVRRTEENHEEREQKSSARA